MTVTHLLKALEAVPPDERDAVEVFVARDFISIVNPENGVQPGWNHPVRRAERQNAVTFSIGYKVEDGPI